MPISSFSGAAFRKVPSTLNKAAKIVIFERAVATTNDNQLLLRHMPGGVLKLLLQNVDIQYMTVSFGPSMAALLLLESKNGWV